MSAFSQRLLRFHFLFWSITDFARKLVIKNGSELTNDKIYGIMAAGEVLLLMLSPILSGTVLSEGEVYALSSFFMTAIVFWAILTGESVSHIHIKE